MASLNDSSWSALYNAQLANYQSALSNDHNMDTKAGVILAGIFAVAVFALTPNLFTNSNRWQLALLVIGLMLYAAAAFMLGFILIPKAYEVPANTTLDHPEYLDKSDNDLMYQLVTDTEFATDKVISRLKIKSLLFLVASVSFGIGTLLLIVLKLIVV